MSSVVIVVVGVVVVVVNAVVVVIVVGVETLVNVAFFNFVIFNE